MTLLCDGFSLSCSIISFAFQLSFIQFSLCCIIIFRYVGMPFAKPRANKADLLLSFAILGCPFLKGQIKLTCSGSYSFLYAVGIEWNAKIIRNFKLLSSLSGLQLVLLVRSFSVIVFAVLFHS